MTTATEVKEHPILFTGEMVRAILDGRKTQTRRVIKPQPIYEEWPPTFRWHWQNSTASVLWADDGLGSMMMARHCPYGQPGDRLWVRETWTSLAYNNLCHEADDEVVYKAQDDAEAWQDTYEGWRWRSPIHMPRWASRLLLEVTDVRVQRVQDISEEDAYWEGARGNCECVECCDGEHAGDCEACAGWGETDGMQCEKCNSTGVCPVCGGDECCRNAFKRLWNSINDKRGFGWYHVNPWVWAVTFRCV